MPATILRFGLRQVKGVGTGEGTRDKGQGQGTRDKGQGTRDKGQGTRDKGQGTKEGIREGTRVRDQGK